MRVYEKQRNKSTLFDYTYKWKRSACLRKPTYVIHTNAREKEIEYDNIRVYEKPMNRSVTRQFT